MIPPPEQVPARRAHHNTPGTRVAVREAIVLQREGQTAVYSEEWSTHSNGLDPVLVLYSNCCIGRLASVIGKLQFGKRTFHQLRRHLPI